MAKYEGKLCGDFSTVLREIEKKVLKGSASASKEDGSDFIIGDCRCAVRVYERYSITGSNRVSLNVTLVGNGQSLILSAITSGGSQAVFMKLNTFGEEAFLDGIREVAQSYQQE